MKINIPEFSLVAMVGASGSGKSSFAAKHFLPTEVISSDACRGMVSDNENDQNVTPDAFDILYYIAGKRLSNFKFTVIDATNSRREDRKKVLSLAREHHCLATAIVL
ncbi:MAG: AAA family ATPase, partial [Anaerolineae bacterium]|nr:AAA family ATPase [Anaerolineae bacterium]